MTFDIDDEVIYGTCDLHPEYLKKDICMEECAELIQAISKCERDKQFQAHEHPFGPMMTHEHHDNECEEIADVLLSIRTLMYLDTHMEDEIQWWIDYKQKRQMIRDFEYMEVHGISPESDSLDYYRQCKEAYDENKLHEDKTEGDVSDE